MIIILLNQLPYQVKTEWKDVSLSDYIRFTEATTWNKRFLALNPTASLVWVSDPDLAMECMRFMGDDPLDNYLNQNREGLPTVAESSLKKYWDSLADIQDNGGLSEFAIGAKVYANYLEKDEAEVLQMPITEVYGAIAFFFSRLRNLRKGLLHSRIHPKTRTTTYSNRRA